MTDSTPQTVWVIERGDYEDRMVCGVAASPQAAERYIKGIYDNGHYIVEWGPLEGDDKGYGLSGRFEATPGWSTKHTAYYDISPAPLLT